MCRWYDLPSEMNMCPCCDGSTVNGPHTVELGLEPQLWWPTGSLNPPGRHVVSEWLCWATGKAETCTLTSPASNETEHLLPVLVASESETWTEEGRCCGLWQTCPLSEFQASGHNLGKETLLCRCSWFGQDRQSANTIKHSRDVPGSENYVLSLSKHQEIHC